MSRGGLEGVWCSSLKRRCGRMHSIHVIAWRGYWKQEISNWGDTEGPPRRLPKTNSKLSVIDRMDIPCRILKQLCISITRRRWTWLRFWPVYCKDKRKLWMIVVSNEGLLMRGKTYPWKLPRGCKTQETRPLISKAQTLTRVGGGGREGFDAEDDGAALTKRNPGDEEILVLIGDSIIPSIDAV